MSQGHELFLILAFVSFMLDTGSVLVIVSVLVKRSVLITGTYAVFKIGFSFIYA